jgi:hypothetical protein
MQNTESSTDVKRQPSHQAQSEPTTGIAGLDKLLQSADYEVPAAVLACLRASRRNADLGNRIEGFLASYLSEFQGREVPKGLDTECEALRALQWLSFMDGSESLRLPSAGNLPDRSTTDLSAPGACLDLTEEEAAQLREDYEECPYLEEIVNWLLGCSFETKLSYVLTWYMISHGRGNLLGPHGDAGQIVDRQYRDAVQNWAHEDDPKISRLVGFATSMSRIPA